jgi:hypothetical protein
MVPTNIHWRYSSRSAVVSPATRSLQGSGHTLGGMSERRDWMDEQAEGATAAARTAPREAWVPIAER